MLTVENLEVSYGDVRALDGVSLEVAEGAIVAIVGANGAGKTSLIRTIAGMLRPARGRIMLRDRRHRRTAVAPGLQSRHRPGGRGPPGVSDADGAENLDMGAMLPRARCEPARKISIACSRCFRCWPSAGRRPPARCPAASSRCWPSPAA